MHKIYFSLQQIPTMVSKNPSSRKLFFLTLWDSLALTVFLLVQCIFSSPDNQSTDTAPWLEAERRGSHFGFKHFCY